MADGLVNIQGITSKEVEELAQILNELNELIGDTTNTGGTATAGTMMAKLNALITANNGGLKVKSVQHGWAAASNIKQPPSGSGVGEISAARRRYINITPVNLNKSILITDTAGNHALSDVEIQIPAFSDEKTLTQYMSYTDSGYNWFMQFNWSIVEFY